MERWRGQAETGREGEVVPIEQLWALAQGWYHNRLDEDYSGRSVGEAMAIFEAAGLTGGFWRV